jgi:hypothetical protein
VLAGLATQKPSDFNLGGTMIDETREKADTTSLNAILRFSVHAKGRGHKGKVSDAWYHHWSD